MTTALPPAPPSADQPTPEQPTDAQPPPAYAPRPELRRSGTDRMLGGVSGGLADYSGIDTVLWRVGFLALTLAGGSGILIYLLLWVLMPSEPLPADREPSVLDGFIGRLHDSVHGAMSRRR